MWPVRVLGAIVHDCWPSLLPVSLQLEDIGPLTLRRPVVSASLAAPPREDCISGVSPEWVAIPELGVAPLVDSETDLEDELPTPNNSLFVSDSSPEGVRLPGGCPAPPDAIDLELEKTHHMVRDRTMSAALQLQHDAGLILSNLQVLGLLP